MYSALLIRDSKEDFTVTGVILKLMNLGVVLAVNPGFSLARFAS